MASLVLTPQERRLVRGWLLEHRGTIAANRWTQQESARRCSRVLGFDVNPSHVYNGCQSLGMSWKAFLNYGQPECDGDDEDWKQEVDRKLATQRHNQPSLRLRVEAVEDWLYATLGWMADNLEPKVYEQVRKRLADEETTEVLDFDQEEESSTGPEETLPFPRINGHDLLQGGAS